MDEKNAWLQFFAESAEGETPEATGGRQEAGEEDAQAPGEAELEALVQREREEQERARGAREQELRRHFENVRRQAEDLRALVPDFDLFDALSDPEFVRRTAPGMIPADEAWVGMHYKEILKSQAERVARRTLRAAAQSFAAGSGRPRENGGAAAAAAVAAPDLQGMSRQARREYIMGKYPPKG